MKRHLLSALYAATATAGVLVIFNAFFNGASSQNNSASAKIASYLHLDKVIQETPKDENNVVGTDNATNSDTTKPSTDSSEPAKTDTSASNATTTPATKNDTTKETIYTVKEGDTYGCIAEKYYGSFEHYVDIMSANPVRETGFGEYSLHVDAKLVLPAIAKENLKPASSLCQ